MKVICGKQELIKGVQTVQTVVTPRSTLPILSNFLFETEGQQIKLSSTDLEVGVTCYVKGEVVKEGNITIPAKRFGDIIKELPEDSDIEIKADESNQINVRCGKSHFVIMGLPKADYPVLPEFPDKDNYLITKAMLKTMLKRTSFAVSNDETRYVLNGVCFIAGKGTLKLVATDGRRLSYIFRDGIDKKVEHQAIIPTKAVNEIQKIISNDEKNDNVKAGVTENQIAFKVDSITIVSRLIEGTFPNYEQVIPKKHDTQVKLNTRETLSAVKQMSLLSMDRTSNVKFTFHKNVLRVTASAQGLGSGEVEIAVEYQGPTIEIAFNPLFMIDILKNIEEDHIYIELTNSLNPAVVRSVKDKSYLCVIMPMRV